MSVMTAQGANGDHDADADGLIEISNLEQLNAIRYDSDGDGRADDDEYADTYAAAFPGTVCANECQGYELTRSLDFDDPNSYAPPRAINADWTTGNGWLPIFFSYFLLDSENSFNATLDGNGHTISNLYINRTTEQSGDPVGVVGLFGAIGPSGVVNDLGLIDADVTGLAIVGGLVGLHLGAISDSYVTGRVSGAGYLGGLAGWTDYPSTISDSHSTAEVIGRETEGESVGGLVGYHDGFIISGYGTGNVSGDTAVGGLVGSNYGGIIASYATGSVTGNVAVGGLAGHTNGIISGSYATGQVSGKYSVGGLAGQNNVVRIIANYATGSVSGDENVGGLVGHNNGHVIFSYSTGQVSGNTSVGGLVGHNDRMGMVIASYSTGQISARGNSGGLIGGNFGQAANSLWDTQTSGSGGGVGDGESTGVSGRTTVDLQAPAGYTGIYAGWAIDLDNADRDDDPSTGVDDIWDFGTSSQYPALKAYLDSEGIVDWWESGNQPRAARPSAPTPTPVVSPLLSVKYDGDADGLIEVSNLDQLYAIRYDLDGDGLPVNDFKEEYAAVYPVSNEEAVCGNGCLGYELSRSLDFADAGSYASGAIDVAWTTGDGWLPIGHGRDYDSSFNVTFDGNGHTVSNLYINRTEREDSPSVSGLFGYAGENSVIRNTGIVGAEVAGTNSVGGLAGWNEGIVKGSYTTGSVTGDTEVGGLVGSNRAHAAINDSYATADVSGGFNVGGLVGRNEGDIDSSYATGNVSGGPSGDLIGGLAGVNTPGTITASYATGDVSGSQHVGGLVGGNSGIILGSYTTGAVSGAYKVGGLAGSNSIGSIIVSYSIGRVNGSGNEVGGLVGSNSFGGIVASYATGSVNGSENVGGLAGESHHSDIVASYAVGYVAGESSVGGLVGAESGTIRESVSYWDTQTTAQMTSASGEGKTTAELQAPTGYTGIYSNWSTDLDNADEDDNPSTGMDDFWDFGSNSRYPVLKFDFDDDGEATWQEFGSQSRDASPATSALGSANAPTPAPKATPELIPDPTLTPLPTPAPATTPELVPTPANTLPPAAVPTATDSAVEPTTQVRQPDANSGSSCSATNGDVPAAARAVSLFLLAAPLAMIGGLKYRRRRWPDDVGD